MKRWSWMNRTKYGGAVSDVINWVGRSILGLTPGSAVSTLHTSTYVRPVGSWLLCFTPPLYTDCKQGKHLCWMLVINIFSHHLMPVFTRICPPALSTLSHHKGIQRNCLSNPQTLLHWWYWYCIHRSNKYNYSSLVCATIAIFLMKWSDKYRDPRSGWSKWLNPIGIRVLVSRYPAVSPQPELTSHYLLTAAHNPGGVKMLKTLPRARQSCSPGPGKFLSTVVPAVIIPPDQPQSGRHQPHLRSPGALEPGERREETQSNIEISPCSSDCPIDITENTSIIS